VDQSPASILITDLAGTIQYVNQKFTEVTGYTYGEVIGQNPRLFKSGETPAETYQQMWSTLLNGGEWRGELLNKKKNGELYWEDTRLSPIVDAQGHPLNFLAIKEDVTERKRLQAEVERSAQLLRTLLDNIPALVYIKNTRSEFIVANEPTARAMGAASPDELIGKTDLDFYPRDMAAQFLANEQDIIRSGQPLVAYEEAATDPNGNPAWHSSTKVPYRGHQGQIEGLVGITIDITQRKRAEQELLRFKLGMERSSDAVFVTDTSGIIQYVNPAFEKIYGYSAAEAIGQTPRIIKSGLVPQEQYAVFWQTLLSKSTVKGEIINRRKDGQHLVIEASNNPIVDESGNLVGFLGVHRDITERKQAEGERERLLATEAKRALQSQTAGEISKAAASILRPDELMPFVVELIRERFDLYYVGLFLTDPAGKWAVLRAGTGEAGRRMLDGFHRLEVGGSSMIGRCVATGQARIALDVGEEAVRFDNPLLPKTRSEMALPLISRGQTLGALTIQSSKLTAFTSDDITVLQTMADQVANAFANAQLFEQSRAARAEAEARLRELTFLQRVGQAVSSTLDLSRVLDALFTTLETEMGFTHTAVIVFDEAAGEVRTLRAGGSAAAMQNLVRPLAQMQNDIVLDVARKGKTEIVEGWDDRLDREVYEREGHADLVRAFAPLRLRDQSIGVLEVGYQRQRRAHITPEEVRLVDGMADQVAIALGNARLFEQANLRADQLAALNRVGQAFAKLAASSEILDIVDSIVGELIGNRNLYIALYDEARQTIEFPVYSIDGERRPVAGRPFGNGMTEYVLRTQAPLLIPHDVSTYAERLGIANIGRDSQCFLAVPMLAGNKALGVIAVQDYERENVYSKEQLDLLGTIASQVAIALENTRLFEQARLRAEELAALNEISRMLTARLDVQQVLNEVYRGASRLLDTANFYIALYEPERNRVSFLINSTQSVIDKEITSMPADHGLTGYIIRTRQSLLIKENVAEWQRQMGVPLVGEPAHSWLGVPLLTGDQILGVMAIQSYTPDHTYDEHDRDVMTAIASQAVIALQNARLFDQTQRNARELATLNELGRAISQQIEVNQVLEVAYQHMQELVQVDAFIVGLYDADANQVAFPVVYDEGQRYDEGVSPLNPASNVGKVILTGEQILVLETAESLAQVTKVAGALGNASRPSASLLYVPLRVGQQIIGALSVQSYQLNAYTEDHVRLVGAVASQLAAALQNVRLFEETRQRNAELATLNQIISSANQTLDLRAMLDTVLRQTLKSFGFDGGLITVYNENRRKLERIVRVGLPGEIPADPAEGLENSLCTYVFDSMKPLVIEDFRQGAPIDVSGEIEAGYYSYIGIPLEAKGRMLGTWCGFRKSAGPFGKNTLALLQVIGRQAGFAIENARLFDETQRDAQREQALREITARVRGSIDPDTIVRTAVRELGVALGRQTFVRLGSQEELMQPPAGSGAVSDSGNGHDRGEEPQGGK
jgi:PAS domain S-box-containing protein